MPFLRHIHVQHEQCKAAETSLVPQQFVLRPRYFIKAPGQNMRSWNASTHAVLWHALGFPADAARTLVCPCFCLLERMFDIAASCHQHHLLMTSGKYCWRRRRLTISHLPARPMGTDQCPYLPVSEWQSSIQQWLSGDQSHHAIFFIVTTSCTVKRVY